MADTFLKANWENLIMANYSVDPAVLIPLLPNGVELDYYDQKAYVSLVGFMFKKTSLFGIPIPLFGSFEEVNLRFYVKRTVGRKIQKGVVFINETVPFKIVAVIANKLYKEHYISIPTKHSIELGDPLKISYSWKMNQKWNSIKVSANARQQQISTGSMEEFIFERYFGFTKIDQQTTQSYRINHPKWQTHQLLSSEVNCNFGEMYGPSFAELSQKQADSIFLANGSSVSVNWKRETFSEAPNFKI
jgi:uncharacterized protein YqjF (DUF2071 family)